jgi:hypothetical protein
MPSPVPIHYPADRSTRGIAHIVHRLVSSRLRADHARIVHARGPRSHTRQPSARLHIPPSPSHCVLRALSLASWVHSRHGIQTQHIRSNPHPSHSSRTVFFCADLPHHRPLTAPPCKRIGGVCGPGPWVGCLVEVLKVAELWRGKEGNKREGGEGSAGDDPS